MNPVLVRGLSPLEVLGLKPSASPDEIRGAFKLIAKSIHPDLNARTSGLYLIAQAAHEAALRGEHWASPGSEGFERSFPPYGMPHPPPEPRQRPARHSPGPWFQNKKGNWCRKHSGAMCVVFEKKGSWHWVGPNPDLNPESIFSDATFDSPEEAMADLDFTLGPDPKGGR